MKIICTDEVLPSQLSSWERSQVYNGMDAAVTAEVLDVLLPQLDNLTSGTYNLSRELQGPCLEMRLRGVLVDNQRKNEVIDLYFDQLEILEDRLERIIREGLGLFGFNWRSNPDLHFLFYEKLGIPVQRKAGKPTVNRDALEKMQVYLIAAPIITHLLEMRALAKKIGVLKTEIDHDGRMRSSYNIAGTNTGRLSSSFSEFGTGTNLQNIEDTLRSIFISDPGKKMAYIDAKQGESRIVGALDWNICNDGRYLDACESGDLHTFVSKMCEPSWPWTGDLRDDRKVAERVYYRHHPLRELCKSIGHGTNYMGGAKTLSMLYKIDVPAIEKFQRQYLVAFPARPRWWANVEMRLRKDGYIISLMNRKRHFWGRRNDPDVHRAAIAYDPQSSLADIVDNGMLRVWRKREVELLMQNHDAIVVQYPEEREDEVVPRVIEEMTTTIPLKNGRDLTMPFDCKTGWNWGEWSKDNPDGLSEYHGGDKRRRSPKIGILDRTF